MTEELVKERQAMLFGRPEIQEIERLSILLVQDAGSAPDLKPHRG